MTLEVARKTINLGWQTASALLVFIITSTYGVTTYINKLEEARQKAAQDSAAVAQDIKDIKASLLLISQETGQKFTVINRRIDSIENLTFVKRPARGGGYVYEFRDSEGNIYKKPAK